jgi:uncharacterized RDD family membrane protein YckC
MRPSCCASFWKRLGAFFIDLIILYILVSIIISIIIPLSCIFSKTHFTSQNVITGIFILITFLVISWFYFAITESSRKQASPGKRIFQIKVIDLQGNRITFFKATLRFWSKFIVFSIFYTTIMIFKEQRMPVKVANTLVINNNIAI